MAEDVRRLGGFGIVAHPDSPKPSLRWTSTARPDGVEWIDRVVLGRYFVGVGAFRFALEFLRVNTRVLGPLTVAHMFAIAVVALGLVLVLRRADARR